MSMRGTCLVSVSWARTLTHNIAYAISAVTLPLSGLVAKKMMEITREQKKWTDARVGMLTEILQLWKNRETLCSSQRSISSLLPCIYLHLSYTTAVPFTRAQTVLV